MLGVNTYLVHNCLMARTGRPCAPVAPRFWKQVQKENDCWLWTGARSGTYGHMRVSGKWDLVHRISWKLHNGDVPFGMWVLHRCDIRLCVRPDHLFLGTAQDNNDDMRAKGRSVSCVGEKNAQAKLTAQQVLSIRARGNTEPQNKIAQEFGVSRVAIGMITKRKRWKHL